MKYFKTRKHTFYPYNNRKCKLSFVKAELILGNSLNLSNFTFTLRKHKQVEMT
jgi:hypothetical protein